MRLACSIKKTGMSIIPVLFPVLVFSQLYLYDTITCENLYQSPELRECLKSAHTLSKMAFAIGGNSLWLAPVQGVSMNDNNANWALGFAGAGLIMSVLPAFSLREAKMILIYYGFDTIPGNELFRAVIRAQAMSTATTVSGIAFLSMAIYGQYSRSDVVFGIGLGGTLACTIMSLFVPIMINNALEIYDRGTPVSFKFGPTRNGIGMVCRF